MLKYKMNTEVLYVTVRAAESFYCLSVHNKKKTVWRKMAELGSTSTVI